jgi:hypothetical protein
MSMQSLAHALLRASRRFGKIEPLSPSETTALLDAELIKTVRPDERWPRYKLTKRGWEIARRLERAAQKDPSGGSNADAVADL